MSMQPAPDPQPIDQGQALAASDVAPGADRATLPLPLATARRMYYLVLRYVNADNGEETIVHSFVARGA